MTTQKDYEMHINCECDPEVCEYCKMEAEGEYIEQVKQKKSTLGKYERQLKRRD